MSIITGALKWDLFVVYIIMCVIFIALCCCSITFMFLCCPAKKENVRNNTFSPMTPFPTTGIAASIALRTAEITAVNTAANSNCTKNGELPARFYNNRGSFEIKHNSTAKKRIKKVARFAEQKSNSIDVPSFSPISENKPSSSNHNGNKISSKAIVEPMPSDMIERCDSIKENILKNRRKCSTASVGTMTPTQALKITGKNSSSCKKKNKSHKTSNNLESSLSSKNCPRDESTEKRISVINASKNEEKEAKKKVIDDLHLYKGQTLNGLSTSTHDASTSTRNCSNGPNIVKTITSPSSSYPAKNKKRKKGQHSLQQNSFQHSVESNILFEFTNSSSLGNFEVQNENARNCSPARLKSKCNEMLSQPRDQRANIECNDKENKKATEEVDGKNSSYRQGLFVIYVDETYVDL